MPWPDLTDLDRVRQSLPGSKNTDEPLLAALITAASRAVMRYCRRDFTQQAYDELYNGTGDRRIVLRQYPLLSVDSVRYRPVTALKIQNTLANTPQARVSVTALGLTLVRVTAGVKTTDTSVTFAGNPTVVAVQNAVNALGNGWTAQGTGYDQWPSADLYCPNGVSGGNGPQASTQGALTAAGQNAELKLHTYELAGYQLDPRRGWLLRAIPYTDPELLHPEDLIWPPGINNFRVQYTAGYATTPEDVAEATTQLVVSLWNARTMNQFLAQESTAGLHAHTFLQTNQLPPVVRALLAPYRNHRIAAWMS
jgi:hypothetical protein